jgi:hypothetical protein
MAEVLVFEDLSFFIVEEVKLYRLRASEFVSSGHGNSLIYCPLTGS